MFVYLASSNTIKQCKQNAVIAFHFRVFKYSSKTMIIHGQLNHLPSNHSSNTRSYHDYYHYYYYMHPPHLVSVRTVDFRHVHAVSSSKMVSGDRPSSSGSHVHLAIPSRSLAVRVDIFICSWSKLPLAPCLSVYVSASASVSYMCQPLSLFLSIL